MDQSNFYIGQLVQHLKFDYRGVIVDVDATFEGTEAWYDQVALSRPPKDQPWYHVLVDQSDQMTYVAQRHLGDDESDEPIENPEIEQYFDHFIDGVYQKRSRLN